MSSEPECKGTPITLGVPNDGQHCACWYEGAACCRCEAPKLADDEADNGFTLDEEERLL